MRAHRYLITGERQVALEAFDFDPDDLRPGEVSVEVEVTAVSPGTETAVYTAADPDVHDPRGWCPYPWAPGYSGVGRVLAAAADVTNVRPGDRVVGLLRHATHGKLTASHPYAVALPGLSAEHAAFVRLAGIAWTPLQHLRPEPPSLLGATCGVWGLGLIGNLAAQLLRSAGLRVTAFDPLPQRCELAERCGLTTMDPASLPGDAEFDVTVDVTGHPPTTRAIAERTRPAGQLCLMTHWRNTGSAEASADLVNVLFARALTLHACQEWHSSRQPGSDWVALHRAKYERLQRLMVDGSLRIDPLISRRVRPDQLREAYEGLCGEKEKWWGVVIDWRGGV